MNSHTMNPNEKRDYHGRWTTSQTSILPSEENKRRLERNAALSKLPPRDMALLKRESVRQAERVKNAR
jgi:hypothetical protein